MTRCSVLLALAGAAALLATSVSVPAEHAHAQEVRKGEAAHPIPYKQESSFGDELVRLGFALACVVVVGAIVIGGYRYLAGVRPASPGRRLKVVETLRLAPRTALFLVEFDRRTLLIGQHGDRLSLIVGPVESGLPGSLDAKGGTMGALAEWRLACPRRELVVAGLCLLLAGTARAADIELPGVSITTQAASGEAEEVSTALKILLGLTVISLAPAFMIAVTSFTRIVIVLAMLRHAIGMQDTPPNTVIVTLALFLTLFTMMPVLQQINDASYQPYVAGKIGTQQAFERGMAPLRDFMIRQTREQDLGLMLEVSKSPRPATVEEIGSLQLIPAFMLSELKSALQIGFVVFLPFLLIDLVVSSVLMSMGMFMVPPVMISLPLKVLMFVLIDGWNLVVRSLIGSFH